MVRMHGAVQSSRVGRPLDGVLVLRLSHGFHGARARHAVCRQAMIALERFDRGARAGTELAIGVKLALMGIGVAESGEVALKQAHVFAAGALFEQGGLARVVCRMHWLRLADMTLGETMHHLGCEALLPVFEAVLAVFQAVVLAVDGFGRRTYVLPGAFRYTILPVPDGYLRCMLRVGCELRMLDQVEIKGFASSAIVVFSGQLDV